MVLSFQLLFNEYVVWYEARTDGTCHTGRVQSSFKRTRNRSHGDCPIERVDSG